jgi:hypothetical protein
LWLTHHHPLFSPVRAPWCDRCTTQAQIGYNMFLSILSQRAQASAVPVVDIKGKKGKASKVTINKKK